MKHYLSRLQDATRKYWSKTALNTIGGDSYTYAQMASRVEKFHMLFEMAGLRKGDHVALCAMNCARWGMSYLAVNTYEAVIVPILADFVSDTIERLVNHSESVILFTDKDKWSRLNIENLPDVRLVVDIDGWQLLYCDDAGLVDFWKNIDAKFAEKYPEGFTPRDVVYPTDNMDDLAVISYTSGSTGNPKGVMLTYKNFSSIIEYSQVHRPTNDKNRMVSMLPMAHMYGLVIEFIYPLCNGTGIFWLAKAPTPATLMAAFREVKPYLLVTVPLVMEKIFNSKIKPVVDKPAVKFAARIPGLRGMIYKKIRDGLMEAFGDNLTEIILGGAALNPEVEKWFKRIKLPYTVGYGMTEATPLLAYESYDRYVPGSCGKAVSCCDVRIDSADPIKVAGEIQAKGDNICIGYYKNPEASAAAFTDDGYLHTGDLGVLDAEGNIFIKGRIKSMILGPSGQNIYPEEVEAVVNNQDYVQESVVVDRERKLVALVFLDAEAIKKAGLSQAEIDAIPTRVMNGSNKSLPAYSRVTKVEIMDKPFEKTPKMSVKRFLYK